MTKPIVSTPSLASKVLSGVGKLAPMLGTYQGFMSRPAAEGGGWGNRIAFIMNAAKKFHIADPMITTQLALAQPENYPIASGLGLAVTGYIVKEVGEAVGIPVISSIGNIAKKGGSAAAVSGLAASYFYEAQNNPHGGGGGASQGQKAFASAQYNPRPTVAVDNPQLLMQNSKIRGSEGVGEMTLG